MDIAEADSCVAGVGGGSQIAGPQYSSNNYGPYGGMAVVVNTQAGVCMHFKAEKDIKVKYKIEGVEGPSYTSMVAGFVSTIDLVGDGNSVPYWYDQVMADGIGKVGSAKQIGVDANWVPSEEAIVEIPKGKFLGLCGLVSG